MTKREASVLILLAVLPLAPLVPAHAAVAQWTALGPYGGDLSALAVAPGARRTLYAGLLYDGVYRSVDAGAHWEKRADLHLINSLAVDPADPLRVYAAQPWGVLISTDGGATWSSIAGTDSLRVNEFAVDPADPEILLGAAMQGLIASHDRGASWQFLPAPALHPSDISAVRFATNGTAWAMSSRYGLFRSLDGGTSWQARSPALPDGALVLAFGLDPASPGTLYVLTGGSVAGDVYRSTDDGGTWTRRGAAGATATAFAVSPEGAVLYAGTGSGVRRSLDGGATWEAEPALFHGRPTSLLAVPPSPPGVVYANTALLGLFKSSDQGASWQWESRGFGTQFILDVAAAPRGSFLYASAHGLGLVVSKDRGATWSWFGPVMGEAHVAVDPRNGRRAWSVDETGVVTETRDGGATAHQMRIADGFCLEPWALAADPRRSGTLQVTGSLYLACEREHVTGCLAFGSTDGGGTWTCDAARGQSFGMVAFDPVRLGTRYAASSEGVARSTDGGRTWTLGNGGLPAAIVHGFNDVLCTPAGVLYLGTVDGVYASRDGALSWKRASTGMAAGSSVFRLVFAPSNPAVLYALTYGRSFYKSTDGGAHWQLLNETGLPGGAITSLTVDSLRPGTIYAGTEVGVYRLDGI
jgi:photosystem II stability/assembly factor-like uncharacterized protein